MIKLLYRGHQANGEVDESPANQEDKVDENKGESNGNENAEENGSEDGANATTEPDADADQEHLQLTVADSDKLDTSNVDNEDSLNLTIGEDEAKIFQEEVMHQKAIIF